jgi:hypothetical protein
MDYSSFDIAESSGVYGVPSRTISQLMVHHRTFISLSPERLASIIMGARRRVVYAAPSVSLEVSSALINASERLGDGNVAIVLDVSEDVFRLGYGVIDALNLLHERNISVRHSEGLRISLLVVDDEGFIFCLPALLVDAARRGDRNNVLWASVRRPAMLITDAMSSWASCTTACQ